MGKAIETVIGIMSVCLGIMSFYAVFCVLMPHITSLLPKESVWTPLFFVLSYTIAVCLGAVLIPAKLVIAGLLTIQLRSYADLLQTVEPVSRPWVETDEKDKEDS